jgi:hypothetical protein
VPLIVWDSYIVEASERAEAYERAEHITQTIIDRRPRRQRALLEKELYLHIDRWKSDTMHWSSLTKMFAHPSYLRIIGLAQYFDEYEVERTLLHELGTEPDYWFAALAAITGENPVQPDHDFDEAVSAWLEWGRKRGIL